MPQTMPMVNLQAQYHRFKNDIDAAVIQVMESAAFIQGSQVKNFENALAQLLNVKHVISCANGTDALQLAFMALNLPEGSEIITPSFSYAALAEVIYLLKLKPVFMDINENSFLIDVSQIEQAITPKTKAIAPVHLFGQVANMEVILEIAKKHNLYVIEDNAQAIGAEYCSSGVSGFGGTLGHIGTTSFFPSKNLGCFGDGGAVFTNDDDLAMKIRMIANHGQAEKYKHQVIGINSRLDAIQAAILSVKLPHIKSFTMARQAVADRYNQSFKSFEWFHVPQKEINSTHVFNQYTLTLKSKEDRDLLKEDLGTNGIPSMIYYPIPLHKQQAYFQSLSLPISENMCDRVLSLPICPELSIENQEYIIHTILKFYQNK
jgi:UDP-2-acetamido-2-deoxy-ribo-hexuluronate aminotransferase